MLSFSKGMFSAMVAATAFLLSGALRLRQPADVVDCATAALSQA